MTWDAAQNRWQGSDAYCLVGASWMHPDVHEAVREWRAPFDGAVTIEASVERPSLEDDGTLVRIAKNGKVFWPSTGWQGVPPRFMVRHVAVVDVRAGDAIQFHVNRNGNEGSDTTNWDPVITYGKPPPFVLDQADIVMDPGVLDSLGVETMDVSLSTIPGAASEGNVWFHSEKFGSDHVKFKGPLDHPGGSLIFEKTAAEFFTANPSNADGQWWLTNVYRAPDGGLLGFVHVEKSGGADKYRLGLAYSTNSGDSWTYLGHVIGQYSDPVGANVSGTPYVVKDGYFYIYFSDMSDTGGIAAVARAPVDEVLAAARLGMTSAWTKYHDGAWTSAGLGGPATGLALPTVSLHSDAAYSTTKKVYVLTGYTTARAAASGSPSRATA